MKITICGAGNAAQTLMALLAGGDDHEVVLFAPLGNEAARLREAAAAGIEASFPHAPSRVGMPHLVTAEAEPAARNADLVLLALPAFAHEAVLTALAPWLPATATIGALPARGGFDWLAQTVLRGHQGAFFGLQTLPWACRIQEWGRRVQVLGAKAEVDIAVWPPERTPSLAAEVAALLGIPMRPVPSFLALTLANPGQIIHPGIMFGQLHAWNGEPFAADKVPLFYGNVDDATAAVLQGMSDEIQTLCRVLVQQRHGLDLGSVTPIDHWLLAAYPDQIGDVSSLRSAFNTNRAYAGIRLPVEPAGEGRFAPAFQTRYLSEDVPFGLLVARGIAELAGVATPTIDNVILWAQVRLGTEYLVDGCVAGMDVATSRAPQRFGIVSVAATGAAHVQA